jgi:flagellar protein FlaG
MSDMSTHSQNGARIVATDAPRKEAAGDNGTPASQGRKSGKTLPLDAGAAVRERVEKHRAIQQQHVRRAVTRLNDYVQSFQRDLRFYLDEELNQPVVHVIDSATNQVIRQIPNEVALRLARNLNTLNTLQQQALSKQSGRDSAGGRLGLINTKI